MIEVGIGKTKTIAILDTGADISIMSEKLYKKLPKHVVGNLQASRLPEITGVTGHKLTDLGSVKVKIELGKAQCTVNFEIIRGISRNLLLGSDLLGQTKAKLDYEQRTLKIGDETILLQRKADTKNSCALVQVNQKLQVPALSEVTF